MSKIKSCKLISEVMRKMKDKDKMVTMLLSDKLQSDNTARVSAIKVPHGKMWIIKNKGISVNTLNTEAVITLAEDRNEKKLVLRITVNDGKDTTYNHVSRFEFEESDENFFNLLLLISNNSLLR